MSQLVDGELSIGDFVVSGGDVAAMVVIEAATRLLAGVMGNEDSAAEESFGDVTTPEAAAAKDGPFDLAHRLSAFRRVWPQLEAR